MYCEKPKSRYGTDAVHARQIPDTDSIAAFEIVTPERAILDREILFAKEGARLWEERKQHIVESEKVLLIEKNGGFVSAEDREKAEQFLDQFLLEQLEPFSDGMEVQLKQIAASLMKQTLALRTKYALQICLGLEE